MRRIMTRTALVVLAALTLAAGLASAVGAVAIDEEDEIELTRQTHVGPTVLEPGRYRLQHEWIEGRHYLVVRSHTTHQGPLQGTPHAETTGHQIARIACRVVSTRMQQAGTGLATTVEPDGTSTLTEVRIRGERRVHVLVPRPQL